MTGAEGSTRSRRAVLMRFAFGFYTGGLLPQQWSYGDAGQTLEGDLRSEEAKTFSMLITGSHLSFRERRIWVLQGVMFLRISQKDLSSGISFRI